MTPFLESWFLKANPLGVGFFVCAPGRAHSLGGESLLLANDPIDAVFQSDTLETRIETLEVVGARGAALALRCRYINLERVAWTIIG